MNRGYLALYDTTEIQKYVYGSSKLKDNIGASNLVERCFSEFLISCIKALYGDKAKDKWKENKEWEFNNHLDLKVEVIYIAGGNALLAVDSVETWKAINYEFGKKILVEAHGLNFVTDIVKVTESFSDDLDKLFKKINNKKYSYKRIGGIKGYCITKECAITKNAACNIDEEGQAISYEVFRKREACTKEDSANKLLDYIAGKSGERYMAVIHIDGNDMGKKIHEILSSEKTYSDAINKIRYFSNAIQNAYNYSFKQMKTEMESVIKKTKEYYELFSTDIPVRKILIKTS